MPAIAQDVTTQEAELDRGATRSRRRARICVATREVKPVSEMIRFVVGPDGEVVPDLKRKLPGRGLWVTATRAVASRRRSSATSSRAASSARRDGRPAIWPTRPSGCLERAALDALAIAGKAGVVVAGFAKVEAAIDRNEVRGPDPRQRRRGRTESAS